MKRSKKLYTLLGVLVVVLIATIGVLKYEEKKEEIKNSGEVILEVAAEDVTGLSWEYDSESLAFYKDGSWFYDEDEAFPVNEEKITSLLEEFEQVQASFVIENVEDYGQYGLDNPECTVTLETEEKTYEISLGDFSTMDSERYMSMGDGNVYLISQDPVEAFEITLDDMIAHDEIPDMDDVTEITLAGAKNYTVTLEETSTTYSEDDLYYIEQDGNMLPLDTDNVESFIQTIKNLDLTDYKTYNVTENDLAVYGLAEPELTITVKYPEEDEDGEKPIQTFTLSVGRDPEEADSAENDDIIAYVRIGESKIIYEITSTEYKELVTTTYDELRHQEIFWADFDSVNQIQITLEGENYTITADGKDDDRTYKYGDEEIEIDDLKTAFTGLESDKFTDEEATGKEEISLTLQLKNDNVSEVTITFYRCDGSRCLAVVDGEPTALVSRADVVDLIEAVNAIVLE